MATFSIAEPLKAVETASKQAEAVKWVDNNITYYPKKHIGQTEKVEYRISRYYSPVVGQRRYYNGKSYEADVTMNCGKSAIANDGCLYTANGTRLDNSMAGNVISCPKEYKLGSKIIIHGKEVTCIDRGGAIKKSGNVVKIDLWCGIGDYALDNWSKCKL